MYGQYFGTLSGTESFDIELDVEDDIEKNIGHIRVQRPKHDLGAWFERYLNLTLNTTLFHARVRR